MRVTEAVGVLASVRLPLGRAARVSPGGWSRSRLRGPGDGPVAEAEYRAVIRARRPWLVWFPWYAGSSAMALVIVTATRNAGL